jgi:hypothetical protein
MRICVYLFGCCTVYLFGHAGLSELELSAFLLSKLVVIIPEKKRTKLCTMRLESTYKHLYNCFVHIY